MEGIPEYRPVLKIDGTNVDVDAKFESDVKFVMGEDDGSTIRTNVFWFGEDDGSTIRSMIDKGEFVMAYEFTGDLPQESEITSMVTDLNDRAASGAAAVVFVDKSIAHETSRLITQHLNDFQGPVYVVETRGE
jgi:hypothetical protein